METLDVLVLGHNIPADRDSHQFVSGTPSARTPGRWPGAASLQLAGLLLVSMHARACVCVCVCARVCVHARVVLGMEPSGILARQALYH
jgi:hypothetical protein